MFIKIILFVLFTSGTVFASNIELETKLFEIAKNMPSWLHVTRDESQEERELRLNTIIRALLSELETARDFRGREWRWSYEDLAVSALNTMWWESAMFDKKVHEGKRRGDRGKSVCLGQIMKGSETLVGTSLDATKRCVSMVFKHLISQQYRCVPKNVKVATTYAMAKVYAGYVTGWSCNAGFKTKENVSIAWNRAEMFSKIKRKLSEY